MYEQPSSKYGKLIRVDQQVRTKIEELRKPGESINAVLRRVFQLDAYCEACRSREDVESIPDVLTRDVDLCSRCFASFEARGWNNITGADFPFFKE